MFELERKNKLQQCSLLIARVATRWQPSDDLSASNLMFIDLHFSVIVVYCGVVPKRYKLVSLFTAL